MNDKQETKGAVAIIVSAGMGLRMGTRGTKKNYLPLCGLPVLCHTLKPFEASLAIESIIIVVSKDDIDYCKSEIVDKYGIKKVRTIIAGGKERQDSVFEGIKAVGRMDIDSERIVLIHDGARCLVTESIISATVMGARESAAAAVMVPVTDTIKEASEDGLTVSATLDRTRLRGVQTPQAFRLDLLERAMHEAQSSGFTCTDSSSLVERLGENVLIVEGSYENIKITTGEDLLFAERILEKRHGT